MMMSRLSVKTKRRHGDRWIKRTIRPRYACRACESVVVQALAPARVMDGGMVTTAFAAHIATSKFAWYLPLNRQAQMLASYGVIIDRGTLGLGDAGRLVARTSL